MRRYALLVPVFLSLLSCTQARALGPEEREALLEVDAIQNRTWAQCTDAKGAKHLVVRVVPQQVPQNPFAPALIPPGTTPQVGYYDLLLYRKENGQDNIGLEHGPQQLSVADRQNGIQARYIVKLMVPAYRVYDPIHGWTPWDSGKLWEKEKINFANYTVTKLNGVWKMDVHYNIMTSGQFEKPKCSDVPM